MANTNDKRIMELRKKIEEKKKEIGKKEGFKPLTKCQIEMDGRLQNLHTFDRKQVIAMLVKLNALLNSAKELELENEYEISGFNIKDWMEDLQALLRNMDKQKEKKKLDELEKQLHKLLSNDKRVELELDEIAESLS